MRRTWQTCCLTTVFRPAWRIRRRKRWRWPRASHPRRTSSLSLAATTSSPISSGCIDFLRCYFRLGKVQVRESAASMIHNTGGSCTTNRHRMAPAANTAVSAYAKRRARREYEYVKTSSGPKPSRFPQMKYRTTITASSEKNSIINHHSGVSLNRLLNTKQIEQARLSQLMAQHLF